MRVRAGERMAETSFCDQCGKKSLRPSDVSQWPNSYSIILRPSESPLHPVHLFCASVSNFCSKQLPPCRLSQHNQCHCCISSLQVGMRPALAQKALPSIMAWTHDKLKVLMARPNMEQCKLLDMEQCKVLDGAGMEALRLPATPPAARDSAAAHHRQPGSHL